MSDNESRLESLLAAAVEIEDGRLKAGTRLGSLEAGDNRAEIEAEAGARVVNFEPAVVAVAIGVFVVRRALDDGDRFGAADDVVPFAELAEQQIRPGLRAGGAGEGGEGGDRGERQSVTKACVHGARFNATSRRRANS